MGKLLLGNLAPMSPWGRYAKFRIMQSILFVTPSLVLIISLRGE
jgi:hypothetical protein